MRWTGVLLALLATLSTIRSQKGPHDFASPLVFPDGSLPDLVPRRASVPTIRRLQTRADCEATCRETPMTDESDKEWRLTRDVLPSEYNLHLDVDVEKFLYNGTVEITIEPQTKAERITLHSDGLTIRKSEIFYLKFGFYPQEWGNVLFTTEDKEHTTISFHLSKPLDTGYKYLLKIDYEGEIRKGLDGFYRSSYKVGNETRYLATTQFETTSARRAFPCFDEPNFKAKFSISITHDKKYSALSNMPIAKSTSKDGRVTDTFSKTPKMSTYLIAFIVSDFKSFKTNDPISSVWAKESLIKDAEYAQKNGVEAVRAMEDFTKIQFTLPKIDHVAVPDFSAGAMENWGLITYQEYLLIKTNESSTPTQQLIPGVIAHEVSHQWFGNLVTLDWWSYTWLNEGFATFFENYVTEIITNGKFAMWQQFIPSKFQIALELDGRPSTSVAMTSKASTPDQISAKFDQISYGKGGCILRMISELLTLEQFRKGLQNYLFTKQYSNAKPDDLFAEWEKVSSKALPKDINFTSFAKSWTEQDGVPVVTVMRDYETGSVSFTQERYYDEKPECACKYNRRWWIPLTWISQNKNSDYGKFLPQTWLRGDIENEKLVKQINITSREWLLVNPRSVGYFRVNYDTKNWLLLTKSLMADPGQFPPENKAQILNDAFLLASSDHLDFAVALGTLEFLPKERGTSVWMSATRIISRLLDEVGTTDAYPLLEEFAQKILTDVYYTVGLTVDPREEPSKSLLRYFIAPSACLFGVKQCVVDAEKNFHNNNDLSSIHPDVITPTLCGAVRAADADAYWNIRKRILSEPREKVQQAISSAMVRCQPDNKLVKRHLEDTLEDNSFSTVLKLMTIQEGIIAPTKYGVAFDFINGNLDKIIKVLGKDYTTYLVLLLIRRVRTEAQYQELTKWLDSNIKKLNDPETLKAELAASRLNTEWNTLHLSDVADWLAASVGREPPDTIPTPPAPTSSPPSPTRGPSNAALTKAAPLIIAMSCVLSFMLA